MQNMGPVARFELHILVLTIITYTELRYQLKSGIMSTQSLLKHLKEFHEMPWGTRHDQETMNAITIVPIPLLWATFQSVQFLKSTQNLSRLV